MTMRPADATRTFGSLPSSLSNPCKPQSSCQDCFRGAILLLNFDIIHGEGLALMLRHCGYKVVISDTDKTTLSELRDEELQQTHFVILDLSHVDHAIFSELRRVCRLRKPDRLPLMVVCWSRIYRGPAFQLLVEKLGARISYTGMETEAMTLSQEK
jgi:hypothetical protein